MSAILEDGLLPLKAAGDFLGVSRATLWRLMSSGQLPFVAMPHRRLIPRKALIAYANGLLYPKGLRSA